MIRHEILCTPAVFLNTNVREQHSPIGLGYQIFKKKIGPLGLDLIREKIKTVKKLRPEVSSNFMEIIFIIFGILVNFYLYLV